MDPLTTLSTRATSQSQRIPGHVGTRQVANHAGGYAFSVDRRTQVRRFLTLGVAGGTFYVKEHEYTANNGAVIMDAAQADGPWLVQEIYATSTQGRAPRQNPVIFALAVAASLGDDATRKEALELLPAICRTATHLFLFIGYVKLFRGWGRGLRRAVAGWYETKDLDQLQYQAIKYRQREGYTHRDALRLSHPRAGTSGRDWGKAALYDFLCRGVLERPDLLPQVDGYLHAQGARDLDQVAALVAEHRLSWEMLPDTALGEAKVWAALLRTGMPMGALIRQLPRLTRLGVLRDEVLAIVLEQLGDPERLRKARIHPVNVLVALKTYAQGHGVRSKATWTPLAPIIDALDAAFYYSFGTLEPTRKRTLLALDVSGSMTSPAGDLPLSCREVTAAMAMATMATEKTYSTVGFTSANSSMRYWRDDTQIRPLPLSPRQRLDDAVKAISDLSFGGTDCALPMLWAQQEKLVFDTIVIYTDNETWAGNIHPMQALAQYRQFTGLDTKLVVVAITGTNFSIGDPADPNCLDIGGFDSAVPQLISDFSRGTLTSGREHLDG